MDRDAPAIVLDVHPFGEGDVMHHVTEKYVLLDGRVDGFARRTDGFDRRHARWTR